MQLENDVLLVFISVPVGPIEDFLTERDRKGRPTGGIRRAYVISNPDGRSFVFVKTHAYGNKGGRDQKYGATG